MGHAKIHWKLLGQLPEEADKALAELAPLLNVSFGEGVCVEVFRAEGIVVQKNAHAVRLGWNKPVQLYRTLPLLRQLLPAYMTIPPTVWRMFSFNCAELPWTIWNRTHCDRSGVVKNKSGQFKTVRSKYFFSYRMMPVGSP